MNFARFCWLNASKFPDREFLIESYPSSGERRALTWSGLEDQTNRLANYLANECQVRKGDIVLHLMTNSLEWFVTYMAVLKTGATITPLNFRFAGSDIKYAADVTGCKVFILGDAFVPRVAPIMKDLDYIKRYICFGTAVPAGMTSYAQIMEQGNRTPILVDTAEDDRAELMFTSGTTGAPKPVCHTHASLFYTGVGNALTYNEGYNSVYLAPHPFYHSGTLFLAFPSYIGAGKILMPMELQPEHYIRSLAEEKCTGGWNTVPTWSDLINAIKSGKIRVEDHDLSALRHIEIGAQPVPFVLLEDSKTIFPKLSIGNIYGITEGGGGGSINLYDEDVMRKPGSIGKATVFMEAKVVDVNGGTLPAGQVGELMLKGPRLMKEYAFNPALTERTMPGGWLHTGDLVHMDDEGYIFFDDRAKDLIIRGGENIYPAEVEGALRTLPKVQDVAILGFPDVRLGEVVLAIIQAKAGETLTEAEVIGFCEHSGMAKYKWPEKMIFATIPRSPAGKIEKHKLRDTYVKEAKEALQRETFKKK